MPSTLSCKILRNKLYNKYNGRCAYCGCELNGIFQIDHIIPKRRYNYEHYEIKGDDSFLNLMPCCASCNACKSDLTLCQFRIRILDRVKRLNKHSSEYYIAKRFGLIKEVEVDGISFYFETINIEL